MPNYVKNTVKIKDKDPNRMEKVFKAIDDNIEQYSNRGCSFNFFNSLVPFPDAKTLTDIRNYWGASRIYDMEILNRTDDSIEIKYDTNWESSLPFCKRLAQQGYKVYLKVRYCEDNSINNPYQRMKLVKN